MEGIIRKRMKEREYIIKYASDFVECISRIYNVEEAYLFGSYARGDFNEWSDIDVLLIVKGNIPENPIARLSIAHPCLKRFPLIEVVILTKEEYDNLKIKKNPLALDVIKHGIKLH